MKAHFLRGARKIALGPSQNASRRDPDQQPHVVIVHQIPHDGIVRQSFAGRLGRLIEPVIAPLGFDWKMGIGIVTSFAAREVFVSTMSTVYNVGQSDLSPSSMSTTAVRGP